MSLFYRLTTFTSEVKQMWHMYKYSLKHPFRQAIFKQTFQNVLLRDYILTLALYTVHTRVKHRFLIHNADYCLKPLNLLI